MTGGALELGWMLLDGESIQLDGTVLSVSRRWKEEDGKTGYDLIPETSGATVSLTTPEIMTAYGEDRLQVLYGDAAARDVMTRPFSSFSQEALSKAMRRLEYVEAIHSYCLGRRKEKTKALEAARAVAERREENVPVWNSLTLWHDTVYRRSVRLGDIRLLLLGERRRGNRFGPYMGSFDTAFDRVIEDRRVHPHTSWADLYEDSMRAVLKEQWVADGRTEKSFECPRLPEISTFHRYRRKRWTEVDQALSQGGTPYVLANHTHRGDGWQATRPMEIVQIDGTMIDFLAGVHPGGAEGSKEMHMSGTPWDEVPGYVHARASAMQAIDVFSGGRVGLYMGFERESFSALSNLLTSVCLPEAAPQRVCERLPEWTVPNTMFGLPENIILDGALANHGDSLLDMCKRLGINAWYAEARRGDQKPHVESAMRTLQDRAFKRMPCRIVKPGEPRPVRERGRTMVPLDFDYMSYVVRWRITHDLNLRPINGREKSPHEIFEEVRNA